MQLFTSGEQAFCEGLIQDLVDTFATSTIFYKNSQELLISQNANYNFAFQNPQNGTTVEYIPVSGTFPARIKYLDNEELKLLLATQNRYDGGEDQLRLLLSKQVVRLKVDSIAAAFIGDVSQIKFVQFDNATWVLHLAPRLHGLFTNRNYTTYYLEKTN